MDQWLHDPRWALEVEARPDEDELDPRRHELVDQLLGEPAVNELRSLRPPLPPIRARVVDVRVEAVLMRSVSEASEAGPEVPAAGTRKVSEPDARGVRIGGPVPTQRGHEGAHQAIGTPPPPAAIGDLAGDRPK